MTALKLPSLGEGIEKGTVISITVKIGDIIAKEQSLMEVETDKVVVEVPSDKAGIVTEILVNLGDEVNEGVPIIKLDVEDIETVSVPQNKAVKEEDKAETAIAAETAVKKTETKATPSIRELKLPSLGEGIEKGTIISILVKIGDAVITEQSLLEVETDKVVVEVPSTEIGIVTEILVKLGDEVSEGIPLIKIESEKLAKEAIVEEKVSFVKGNIDEEKVEDLKATLPIVNQSISFEANRGHRSSPLAKKIAREIGIDIANMPATNPSKRISVQDVKNYAKQLNQSRASHGSLHKEHIVLPDFTKWGPVRKESMTGIVQATSKNMSTSWSQIPHAWLQEKVDITHLEEKRQNHKHAVKAKGGALTITGILVKIVAKALENFPMFNASIDHKNNTIIYKEFINIGVAVDTDRGLLVPVLKNIKAKSMIDIAKELPTLANKVKQRKISGVELEGATFTISNLGGIGTSAIFPLVTFPQVAILGVAASQKEAVWIDGRFQPRLLMPLTIGFDHRIINGADAARFLKYIKELLEDWFIYNLD